MINLNTDSELQILLIKELTVFHSSPAICQFLNLLNIELLTFVHSKYSTTVWNNNNKVKADSWMLYPKNFQRDNIEANVFTFYKPNEIYYQQNYKLFVTTELIENLDPLTIEQTIKKLEELYDRTKHES